MSVPTLQLQSHDPEDKALESLMERIRKATEDLLWQTERLTEVHGRLVEELKIHEQAQQSKAIN